MNVVDMHTCLSVVGLVVFFAAVVAVVLLRRPQLVLNLRRIHGRAHRFVASALLLWLCVGVYLLARPSPAHFLLYDVVLAFLGVATTLSAARDFAAHRHVTST
jgi:hypothetical protein